MDDFFPSADPFAGGVPQGQTQGAVLNQLSGQYGPLAGGSPFRPAFGLEGVPVLGSNPLLGMLAQPLVSQMMGRVGMSPMGLNDRNVFDTLQNQRYFRMQQDLQRQAAELDREGYMNTMRGMAAMTGTPWGADQVAASRGLADKAVAATPMLSMMFPDQLDELGGYRGSGAVMAGRMMSAGRYRLDPVTGRLGQSPDQVAAQARQLYEEFYLADPESSRGVSAGQMGQLFEGLSARGMLGGVGRSPTAAARRAFAADPILFREARDRAGLVAGNDPSTLTADELSKLTGDSVVSDRLRALDTNKVKQSLSGYLEAVNAVRDVFGDAGRPNAPMAELLGALSALTNNSLGQVAPGQLNTMVRMTQQLANNTGLGMDNALVMQQYASAKAGAMGIEPVFGVLANQGAMAFGAAYRSQGNPPAWGRGDADWQMRMDANLRVNAASSRMANRMGLALRIAENGGGFAAGSDAALYAEALKSSADTGATTWTDAAGHAQQLAMGQPAFERMLAASGVPEGASRLMMLQGGANREFVARYNLGDVARRGQTQSDFVPFVGDNVGGFLQGQLQGVGLSRTAARRLGAAAGQGIAADILEIGNAEFAAPGERDAAIAGILRNRLGGAVAGQSDRQMKLMAESLYGFVDTRIAMDPGFGYLKGFQNLHAQANGEALAGGSQIVQTERRNAEIRNAMAPLNRGSMLRRAAGYVQSQRETGISDDKLIRGVATVLGGMDNGVAAGKITPKLKEWDAEKESLLKLSEQIATASPETAATLRKTFDDRVHALNGQIAAAHDQFAALGVDQDLLSSRDTSAALYRADANSKYAKEVGDAQVGGNFAAFWATDTGKEFALNARAAGAGAADVAARFLSSPASVRRLGLAGVEKADAALSANRELTRLAAVYAGGDVAKLQAGDLGGLGGDDKARIMDRVQQQTDARRNALQGLHALVGQGGRHWDVAATAKQLGVAEGDVAAAMGMDDATANHAMTALGMHGEAQKKYKARYLGANADETMRAAHVLEMMQARADTASGKMSAEEAGRNLLTAYGVAEESPEKLAKIGGLLATERGRAIAEGLTVGQKDLAAIAKRGGIDDTPTAGVDQLFDAYRAAQKGGSVDAFRKKFGLEGKDEFGRFMEEVGLQEASHFSDFGEGGTGRRHRGNVADAEALLGKFLEGGGASKEDKPLTAGGLLEALQSWASGGFKVTMTDASGKVTGTGTASAQGKAYAPAPTS